MKRCKLSNKETFETSFDKVSANTKTHQCRLCQTQRQDHQHLYLNGILHLCKMHAKDKKSLKNREKQEIDVALSECNQCDIVFGWLEHVVNCLFPVLLCHHSDRLQIHHFQQDRA